ncbi:MAG: peroxide stress protein YaaA, partial [Proteobacteria bacterium]|nr:peroxide stress protein YaaA [Pseudomonadota bacterium]
FVFDGDVYKGIDVENYDEKDLEFAQQHLRILSGLYGILKPLDLIQAYRLEMGTKFKNSRGKDLYQFWQNKISDHLNDELEQQSQKVIINLASNEYFDAVKTNDIKGKIINIIFKEKKGDDYKIIGLFAKRARGLMADYIIKNAIDHPEKLKNFTIEGYKFMEQFSNQSNWHFYRS